MYERREAFAFLLFYLKKNCIFAVTKLDTYESPIHYCRCFERDQFDYRGSPYSDVRQRGEWHYADLYCHFFVLFCRLQCFCCY